MSVASRGDWICSDVKCKNLNFAKRDKCHRCGRKRKYGHPQRSGREIGKEGAEKSKGLFSQDDWICKNCGNVNWARRTSCNACNTPLVNTLGERTGYGGGFMERDEVVEYKRRNDSDDEYDEFGRKKKRFRTSADVKDTKSSQKADSHADEDKPAQDVEGDSKDEEEDEEESGDDNDLSKYDIWGEEEEEKEENGTTKESNRAERDSTSSSSGSESDSSSTSTSASSDRAVSHSSGSSKSSSSSRIEDLDQSDERPSKNVGRRKRTRSRFEGWMHNSNSLYS